MAYGPCLLWGEGSVSEGNPHWTTGLGHCHTPLPILIYLNTHHTFVVPVQQQKLTGIPASVV